MKLSTHLVRRGFAAAALLFTGALFTAPATAAPTASLDATCQDPGAREQLAQLRRQIAELHAAQAELRRELERLRGAHGQAHGAHGEHGEQEEGEHAEQGEVEQRARAPRRAQGFVLGQPGARAFTIHGGMRGMRAGSGQFTVQGSPLRGRWMASRPQGRAPGMAMRGFAMPRMQVFHGPGHMTWQVGGDGHEGHGFAGRADAPHARQDAHAQPQTKAKPQKKAKPKTQGKPGEKRGAKAKPDDDDKPDNQSIFRSLQLAPVKKTVRVETEDGKGDAQGHRVFRVLKEEGGEKAGEHEVHVEVHPQIRLQRDAKEGASTLRFFHGGEGAHGEGQTVEVKDLELKVEKAKKAPKKAAPQKKISVSV